MRPFASIYIILLLWIAGLCAAAQYAKMALFLPELEQLYPEAGVATGFLITLISLVGALFGLVAGMLVAQLGPRRVLLAGMAIGSLMSLSQSLSLPLSLLLVTRVLEGVSHLAIVVAAPTLIVRYSSDRVRAISMTLWGTFFGVSFTLTAWLGLSFVGAQGIHALFLVHGLILCLTTVLVMYSVPGEVLLSGVEPFRAEQYSLVKLFRRHRQAWMSPYVAAPAFGWLSYTITFVALLAILPSLLPFDQRTFVAGAMPLASIFSSVTLGLALLRRYPAVQVINIGFISAIGFAVLFTVIPVNVVLCIVLFSALGLVQGASFAAIPQLNPTTSNQALAYGAIAQAGNVGNLCGTPLLLTILYYGDTNAMFVSVVACYIMAIMFHIAFSRQRGLDKANNPR